MQATQQRAKAIRMAKVGMPYHQIAFSVGLDLSDLRTLYAKEMRHAAIEANLQVWETLWQMARSGNNAAATMFWLRVRAEVTPVPAPTKKSIKESKKPVYCTEIPPPGHIRFVGPNGEIGI
jgi:hypothetical protein